MIAAAAAWDGLAAEANTTATGYSSVIEELTGSPWVGPASRAMVSAVAPYVSWLGGLATLADDTASQARAAAAAFEITFGLTVPPPLIAANRVTLVTLVGTNFFGQNTAAIAATEADYAEMWAQDAAAMYDYAASSAVATELSRFSSPPNPTSPGAIGDQSAAVAQATATPAGDSAQTITTTIPQLLSSAAFPQAAAQQLTAAASGTSILNEIQQEAQAAYNAIVGPILPTPSTSWWQVVPANYTTVLKQTLQAYFGVGLGSFGFSIGQQTTRGLGATAGAGGAWFPTPQFAALGAGGWGFHTPVHTAGSVGSLGAAGKIGTLSVPVSWEGAPAATTKLVSANFADAPSEVNAANGVNTAVSGLPAGGARGSQRATEVGVRYGIRYKVLVKPPSAG